MNECSVCSVEVEEEDGGMVGFIGLLPFNLCPTCKAGVYDWACQQWECAEVIDET